MSEPERPNPDEILARLKRDETESRSGQTENFLRDVPGCREDLCHAASRAAEASRRLRSRGWHR